MVDFHFEVCRLPRAFEWNFMTNPILESACVDIDGVLCVDPTPEQNDDGPAYESFLDSAAPLHRPSRRIFALVTSRLEKYRVQTEKWLAGQNIEYGHLHMMDVPDMATRRRLGNHADFKAAFYAKSKARLFIESEPRQALRIAEMTDKPVLCVSNCEMIAGRGFDEAVRGVWLNEGRAVKRGLKQSARSVVRTARGLVSGQPRLSVPLAVTRLWLG
jgi:uncharacterized HAD superfamily protein